jgi:flagellar biosynthesis protein FlhG
MLKTVAKGIFKSNSKETVDFTERIIRAYYNNQKNAEKDNFQAKISQENYVSNTNNSDDYANHKLNVNSELQENHDPSFYDLPNIDDSVSNDQERPYDYQAVERKNSQEEKPINTNKDVKVSQSNKRNPQIISIGGGKGGIGKSFISANICVRLASLGYKVAVVDLDLGAANLHTCLGVPTPRSGIADFIHGNVSSLEETGINCCLPNLTLYGGGQEFWQQVKPQSSQKIKLITRLQELDADFVILDLGAGTHVHTLDFFIFSHGGILVVAPEPTSIENAYVFMKSILYRKIQSICKAFDIEESIEKELLNKISSPKNSETPFSQLVNFSQKYSEVGKQIKDMIEATNIGIIMNQVRTKEDKNLGESMSVICNRYFGFTSQFLGSIKYDDAVWKSVRVKRPLVLDYPLSTIAVNINNITDKLTKIFMQDVKKDNLEKAG